MLESMKTIERWRRRAEKKSRRELEEEAVRATELRLQMATIGREVLRDERERVALELFDRTELTQKEIGEVVDQSQAWVSQVVNQSRADR